MQLEAEAEAEGASEAPLSAASLGDEDEDEFFDAQSDIDASAPHTPRGEEGTTAPAMGGSDTGALEVGAFACTTCGDFFFCSA